MADSAAPADTQETGYRVLARKYRPDNFNDLIGQEPMVQTLRNAFEIGRIAQAYILTGVRGVGKTTTARILARGLNYATDSADDGPTVDLKEPGLHCKAIMEGRHVDVIEMDAASHNGVADIREITDAARYSPVSARYKVYLLDEVHMLSTAAFNALLKTLEEPPDHVKFIFATTEINKVPVTILSRCQRFDLRRVEVPSMMAHLGKVVEAEGASADEDALRLIARASEGSVRDALSLLDQAISHVGVSGGGNQSAQITGAALHEILNLADQSATLDLFESVMKGDAATALNGLAQAYARGTDPAGLIADLAEMVHAATRHKVMPGHPFDALTADNQARLAAMADDLAVKVLSRAWQMLLKGLDELARAPKPLIAAEMILVRLAYVADLPTPDEAIRKLDDQPAGPSSMGASPVTPPSSGGGTHSHLALAPRSEAPAPVLAQPVVEAKTQTVVLRDLDALIALAEKNNNRAIPPMVRAYVRPVSFGDNKLEIGLAEGAPQSFLGDLAEALKNWTGQRWMISLVSGAEAQTLNELAAEREVARRSDASQNSTVQALMKAFPGASITQVRSLEMGGDADVDDAGIRDIGLENDTLDTDVSDTLTNTDEDPPWTS
jgi:DNA polymerase-3 subunit gamma/tau